MAVISQSGEILVGREIKFLSQDEQRYPQLLRLALDFDFRVLAVPASDSHASTRYLVTYKYYRERNTHAITPAFDTLSALEKFTNDKIIDILHDTLFEGMV